jgi:hypothetical protein
MVVARHLANMNEISYLITTTIIITITITITTIINTTITKVVPPSMDAKAALHDEFFEETNFLSFKADQAKCQVRQRATTAQQLHALLVVAEPQLQRRELKRALRQRKPQFQRRLQMVDAHAAGTEDGASGRSVEHKRHVAELL